MDLTLIIDTLFWIIIGYAFVKALATWIDFKLAQKLEKEIGDVVRDLDSGKLIPLTVELHNNQFLCYNSLTADFVCQGENLSEIAQRFGLRYPGRRATIHKGDTEVISRLKQQFRDGVENISLVSR